MSAHCDFCQDLERRLAESQRAQEDAKFHNDLVLAHGKTQEAELASMRQQLADVLIAMEKIARGPAKPFPDPLAHSWQAYAEAIKNAWSDARFIAINTIQSLK